MIARILIAGLGNVLMSDDAIGPYCAEYLRANYTFPENVDVLDLGSPGLDLALHLSSADSVVAIDALRGVEPGTLHVFDRTAILTGNCDTRLDTHAPALQESILIAHFAGERPSDVRLVGLGGANFDHGTGLSPVARAGIAALSDRVLAELSSMGVAWRVREPATPPDVWWEEASVGAPFRTMARAFR